jgi:hypothetical protein
MKVLGAVAFAKHGNPRKTVQGGLFNGVHWRVPTALQGNTDAEVPGILPKIGHFGGAAYPVNLGFMAKRNPKRSGESQRHRLQPRHMRHQ